MDKIEIVSLKPEEWQLYRDIRLKALKEEPQAFGSTYVDNSKRPDEFWMQRLDDASKMFSQWLVFAKVDKKIVGMVGAFLEKLDEAHVIAVYVVPEAREKGISKMLMKELLAKIKTNGEIKKIVVDVNPEQVAALNLYKHSGFRITKKYRLVLGDGNEHDVYQLQMLVNAVL